METDWCEYVKETEQVGWIHSLPDHPFLAFWPLSLIVPSFDFLFTNGELSPSVPLFFFTSFLASQEEQRRIFNSVLGIISSTIYLYSVVRIRIHSHLRSHRSCQRDSVLDQVEKGLDLKKNKNRIKNIKNYRGRCQWIHRMIIIIIDPSYQSFIIYNE